MKHEIVEESSQENRFEDSRVHLRGLALVYARAAKAESFARPIESGAVQKIGASGYTSNDEFLTFVGLTDRMNPEPGTGAIIPMLCRTEALPTFSQIAH